MAAYPHGVVMFTPVSKLWSSFLIFREKSPFPTSTVYYTLLTLRVDDVTYDLRISAKNIWRAAKAAKGCDGWTEAWLWHCSEKYSKKYLLYGMVIFKKIFFGWDGDGRAKPCLWHFSEKYSKKYLFDRVVMTTHNHGCGTAQKNIQTNICWMGWWWLGKAMVVILLNKIFKKIFFG